MRLTLTAHELLALHDLLHSEHSEHTWNDDERNEKLQLKGLHERINACILVALSLGAVDPVDAWMKQEQERISRKRPVPDLMTDT